MNHKLSILAISVIVTIAMLVSMLPASNKKLIGSAIIPAAAVDGISKIDLVVKDKTIYLNILTNKFISCNQIIEELRITDISIESKIYTPVCVRVNDHLIRISYQKENFI